MSPRNGKAIKLLGSVCGVLLVVYSAGFSATRKEFPARHNMIDVTKYGAIPNDNLSDQAAIKAAIGGGGNFPNPRILYFPAGTYIFEDTIRMWGTTTALGGCCATFQGQGIGTTVLKLKETSTGYGNASSPKPFIATSIATANGNSFRFNIYDLTVQVGTGNAGATAIDYNCNNQGSIENVDIIADGPGFAGLAMTREWPGPCLVKNVTIRGFTNGVYLAQSQYGIVFDSLTLEGQTGTGFNNLGNFVSICGLTSTNSVPAMRAGGYTVLVNANLRTPSGTSTSAAVVISNGVMCYAANVTSTGYAAALSYSGANIASPVREYCTMSSQINTMNGDTWGSLKLPIKHSPQFHENDTSKWVCTADFTEAPSGGGTAYPSLKKAVEFAAANGKTAVYAPQRGSTPYPIFSSPIVIPASIKQLVGFDCQITPPTGSRARIEITGNTTDPLIIEGWRTGGILLQHNSNRPVVIKHCAFDTITNGPGAGDLFIEDMSPIVYLPNPQHVWMRQANPENLGGNMPTRINNAGALLWILGLKTEGVGTIATTSNGGSTEILGGFIYPVVADNLAKPAFTVIDACMTAMFVYAGGYTTLWSETRNGTTKTLAGGATKGLGMYVANIGCVDKTPVQFEPGPSVAAKQQAPAARKLSSLTLQRRVVLPANARGLALFNVRGAKVWEFVRHAEGEVTVDVPRSVAAAGVAVVKYRK